MKIVAFENIFISIVCALCCAEHSNSAVSDIYPHCTCSWNDGFKHFPNASTVVTEFVCCDVNLKHFESFLKNLDRLQNVAALEVDQFVLIGLNPNRLREKETISRINSLHVHRWNNHEPYSAPVTNGNGFLLANLFLNDCVFIDSDALELFLWSYLRAASSLVTLQMDHIHLFEPTVSGFHLLKRPLEPNMALTVVSMTHCNITTLVGVDLLHHLSTIRMVSLAHNQLTTIDNQKFFPQNATQFWYLNLSHNRLSILPGDWSLPTSITHLHLENNYLKTLSDYPFENVWHNLQEFWIHSNNFECAETVEQWSRILNQYQPPVISWTCLKQYRKQSVLIESQVYIQERKFHYYS